MDKHDTPPAGDAPALAELEGTYWRSVGFCPHQRCRVVGGRIEFTDIDDPECGWQKACTTVEDLADSAAWHPMTPAEIAETWPELAPAAPAVAGEGTYWRGVNTLIAGFIYRVQDGAVQVLETAGGDAGKWCLVSTPLEALLDPARHEPYSPRVGEWIELLKDVLDVPKYAKGTRWQISRVKENQVYSSEDAVTPLTILAHLGYFWLPCPPPDTAPADVGRPLTPAGTCWAHPGALHVIHRTTETGQVQYWHGDDVWLDCLSGDIEKPDAHWRLYDERVQVADPTCPPPAPAKPATEDVLTQVFFTLEAMDERLADIERSMAELADHSPAADGGPLDEPPAKQKRGKWRKRAEQWKERCKGVGSELSKAHDWIDSLEAKLIAAEQQRDAARAEADTLRGERDEAVLQLQARDTQHIHPLTWPCQGCGRNKSDLHMDVCAECWAAAVDPPAMTDTPDPPPAAPATDPAGEPHIGAKVAVGQPHDMAIMTHGKEATIVGKAEDGKYLLFGKGLDWWFYIALPTADFTVMAPAPGWQQEGE